MRDRLTNLDLPQADALNLIHTIDLYECLWLSRPAMPTQSRVAARLIELLDHVDGFILDGHGVINVGDGPIDGIRTFLETANVQSKPVVVLTNGASYSSVVTWQRYQGWSLPISQQQIVSSRDVLEEQLEKIAAGCSGMRFGCLGKTIEPLGYGVGPVYGRDEDFWDTTDVFLFLGALDWDEADQLALEKAMLLRPRPLHVANPDVSAPQANERFSAEPGYWTARLIQRLAENGLDLDVSWYGKPHALAFDIAQNRIAEIAGRHIDAGRLAMVGDSLHTDVLGAAVAGLQTVLVTGYGLFRGTEIGPYIKRCNIRPDWLVEQL